MTTTIIPARERAQAPIGCAYVAPLFWNKWFRWDGSRASGHYQLGERTQDEHHTGLAAIALGRLSFALEDAQKQQSPYGKITRDHARNAEYPQDEERGA